MADTKIGSAFVEVAMSGVSKVMSDMEEVRTSLRATGQGVESLRKALSSSPLALALELDKSRGDIVDKVKKDIEGLPRQVQIAFVADQIKAVEGEISALREQLDKTPDNKTIHLQLKFAETIQADLAKEINSIKPPPLSVALGLGKGANLANEVKNQIANLPRKVKIAILAENIENAKAKIADLKEKLKQTPNDKVIKLQLLMAQNTKGDLDKQMAAAKGSVLGSIGGMAKGVASTFGGLAAGLSQVGGMASGAFSGATGAIKSFVSMADPKGFEDFQVATASVSIQLGRIFVPLLHEVTEWINKLSNYLKNLSDDQREQVLHWTKIALAVAGGLMVFSKVHGVLGTLSSAFGAFGGSTLGVLGPLGLLLGLAGAVIPILTKLFGTAEEGEGLGGALGGMGDAFASLASSIGDAFRDIIETVGPIVSQILEDLAPVFTMLAEAIKEVIPPIVDIFKLLFEALGPIIRIIISILQPVLKIFGEIIKFIGNIIIDIINVVISAINAVLEYIPGTSYIGGSRDYQLRRIGEGGDEARPRQQSQAATGNEFRGEAKTPPAQIIGLAEAWKKVQMSQEQDAASRIQQEVRDNTRRTANAAEESARNSRPAGWAAPGGAM